MELTMFLTKDQEAAKKEIDHYGYLMSCAISKILVGDFKAAANYHERISRSLKSLNYLKKSNQQVNLILKQIEGSRQHFELLEKMRGQL